MADHWGIWLAIGIAIPFVAFAFLLVLKQHLKKKKEDE